jgi:hypothetical protein
MSSSSPTTLSQLQFEVLRALLHADKPLTQRELHQLTDISLGSVNSTVRQCEAAGYISERALTEAGRQALAPYKVDNAIIMAAGLSQRFAPISYERPKGTLRVRGQALIDRQIEQLREAGINDITVVVGYKKEHFFYLAAKYGVKIVVNSDYATRNNNGSLWLVREQLANTYICSSDDYFTVNPFEDYVYQAYYSAQYAQGPTAEWCITTGAGGRITGVSVGGANAWYMLGHVYFDRAFSATFRRILESVYHLPETAPKLWESIYLDHIRELNMVMRPYPEGVINEFDSVDEIRSFDPMFLENLDSDIFTNITSTLGCQVDEITDFYPLKQGITNLSCHFRVGDQEYVYRHPGAGTDKIVDRAAEFEALNLARDLGIDHTFITGDTVKGWKISRFIPDAANLDVNDPAQLTRAMDMARTLHSSDMRLSRHFDFVTEGLKYEAILRQFGPIDVPDYQVMRDKIMRLKRFTEADGYQLVPSHNDFFPLNFLVSNDASNNEIDLIDWEYAGMSDPAADFGTMVVCASLSRAQSDAALAAYLEAEPTAAQQRHFYAYVAFAGWCWYVWSLVKEAEGDDVGQWLYIYYQAASDNIDWVLAAYEQAASQDAASAQDAQSEAASDAVATPDQTSTNH